MTAIEKLAEVEAEEKLAARGYVKTMCQVCRGSGLGREEIQYYTPNCLACGGSGIRWIKGKFNGKTEEDSVDSMRFRIKCKAEAMALQMRIWKAT